MNTIIPQSEIEVLQHMPLPEANRTSAQMLSLLSAITQEKRQIDSMTEMLNQQSWFKRIIYTVFGKNKATVAEIREHKDKIAAYTAQAVAILFQEVQFTKQDLLVFAEQITQIKGQLAAQNASLFQTQNAMIEMRNQFIQTISTLSDTLNAQIASVDNYHMLISEIELKKYSTENGIANLFSVLVQIDRRMVKEERQLDILRGKMKQYNVISDTEYTLSEYMNMLAKLPVDLTGLVYLEVSTAAKNGYARLFQTFMEQYSFLPEKEKCAINIENVIEKTCASYQIPPDTVLSEDKLFQIFLSQKKELLLRIPEMETEIMQGGVLQGKQPLYISGSETLQLPMDSTVFVMKIDKTHSQHIGTLKIEGTMQGGTISINDHVEISGTSQGKQQLIPAKVTHCERLRDKQWLLTLEIPPEQNPFAVHPGMYVERLE